jgi:type II secretion system protein N
VQRILRAVAILAGALIALGAIVVIGLNLYVQSLGTQARIQQELSQRLGAPVRIKAVSVTPWGGLTLSGISVPQSAPGGDANFLAAESFELHAGVSSLFSGSLIIKKVSVVSPKILWPQDEDGKWRLPNARNREKAEERAAASLRTEAPSPPAVAAASPGASAPPPVAPEAAPQNAPPTVLRSAKPAAVLIPDVQRAVVTNGEFRFLDRVGSLVAAFEGVDLHASVQSPTSLQGTVKITRLSAHDRFFLEKLRSPFHYDQNELDVPKIVARAAGGEVIGAFNIQPQFKDSPFKFSFKFRDLQADQVVTDAGGSPGMIQGKLEGNFEATGNASDSNALAGTGQIVLHDGQLQQYSLLVALGQILQIEELTQLHLEQAEAKYHVTPGLVTIDEIILRSPNIRLSATGTVNFNGKLHLDSQLAINDKVRSQLYRPIRENFQPMGDDGYSAVQFQVAGTLDRPRTNLVDRVVGHDLKDVLSGFLGGKKAEKPKKKKQMQNAAPPTETPAVGDAESSASATPGDTASSPAP